MRRNCLPSSSSGLGRSPLKAETGVRLPVGVQNYFYNFQIVNNPKKYKYFIPYINLYIHL